MEAFIGLSDLRTVRISNVPAGQLFYAFGDGTLVPGLCLKVGIKSHDDKEPFLQAYVMLEGETRFHLFKLQEEQEDDAVLPLLASGLTVKFDTEALSAVNKSAIGTLLVAPAGPCLLTRGPGKKDMLVRLSDGLFMDPRPAEVCFVSDWRLISVNANGAEKVLLTFAPGSEPATEISTTWAR